MSQRFWLVVSLGLVLALGAVVLAQAPPPIRPGDGNVDRIAAMGWVFPTAKPERDGAFLTDSANGKWVETSSLVQ